MDFYSYQFFIEQAEQSHYGKYAIFLGLIVILLVLALKQFRSKEKRKYRDIFVLITLAIVFFAGIQVNEFEVGKANQSNASQMAGFLESVSKSQHVPLKKLAVNSKVIRDEMLIKVDQDFYQINMNTDLSSYKLEETFLINDQINLVEE